MRKIASGLASLGRGRDTMLVHMSPREVDGLQKLAMATGGSLTINPHTGLHEAGWLESILPMVAGGAMTVMSGGTLSPLAAAMITGAGTGVVTGDWEKGMMAGLGAYGGASLAGGITGVGAAEQAAQQAAQQAAAEQAAQQAAQQAATESAVSGIAAEGASELPMLPEITVTAPRMAPSSTVASAASAEPAALSASQKAAQGWKNFQSGIRTLDSGKGWMKLYEQPTMGMKGSMAAAMPIMSAMSDTGEGKSSPDDPAQYYVTQYSPGEQMVPGQGYLSGQGYAPGYWTEDYKKALGPYEAARAQSSSPHPRNYSPTDMFRERFGAAAGGVIPPIGRPDMSQMEGYYKSLLMPPGGSVGQPAPGGQPSGALADYMQQTANINNAPPQPTRPFSYAGLEGGYGYGMDAYEGTLDPNSKAGANIPKTDLPKAANTMLGPVTMDLSHPLSPGYGPNWLENRLGIKPNSDLKKFINPISGIRSLFGADQPKYKQLKDGTVWFNGAKGSKKYWGGTIDPVTGTVTVDHDPNGEWSTAATNYLRTGEGDIGKQGKRLQLAIDAMKKSGWSYQDYNSLGTPSAPAPADVNPNPQGMAGGGITALAGGGQGRLLRGPGDGVSDSIPAMIHGPNPQEAALADGEFVFPARVVSEIGNGSTEAGARKLYAIMDQIQTDRKRTAMKGGIAMDTNAERHFRRLA